MDVEAIRLLTDYASVGYARKDSPAPSASHPRTPRARASETPPPRSSPHCRSKDPGRERTPDTADAPRPPPAAVPNCTRRLPTRSCSAPRSPPRSGSPAAAIHRSRSLETTRARSSVAFGVTRSHSSTDGLRFSANKPSPRRDLLRHVARLEPPQHRRLQPAEAEVERVALHLGQREPHRLRIPVRREHIDHRPARIPESQEFRDLVERLARRIVASLPQQPVAESFQRPRTDACARRSPPSASAGYSTGLWLATA